MLATVPTLGLFLGLVVLITTWAALRFLVILPFRAFTVHRGRFHSLPTAALTTAWVATVAGWVVDPVQAWLLAGLFLLGFLTHLALDETFSVDLGNRKIKRSFGTALKLFARGDLRGYLVLYGLLAASLWLTPSPTPLVEAIAATHVRWLPPEGALDLLAGR